MAVVKKPVLLNSKAAVRSGLRIPVMEVEYLLFWGSGAILPFLLNPHGRISGRSNCPVKVDSKTPTK
jgi:hypothetical protein